MLKEHDVAPAWSAPDHTGAMRSSSEFLGKWTVLYFYPKDDTPGCTAEACGFRDGYTRLNDRIAIVGVSADSVESHRDFASKFSLPFTLISDPQKTIITAFGTDGTTFPKRTTFLIDPEGTIRKIYHGFDCNDHVADVERDMSELGL